MVETGHAVETGHCPVSTPPIIYLFYKIGKFLSSGNNQFYEEIIFIVDCKLPVHCL